MALLTLLLIPTTLALAQSPPACLLPCLEPLANQTSTLCTNTLPDLLTCLTTACSTIPLQSTNPTLNTTTAAHTLTLSPQRQPFCETSSIISADTPTRNSGPKLDLTSESECVTNDWKFGSFTASPSGSEDWQELQELCVVMVYPEGDCSGIASRESLANVLEGTCVWREGRSVRLVCAGNRYEDALAYVTHFCRGEATLPIAPSPMIASSTSSVDGARATTSATLGLVIPVVGANGTVFATEAPQSPPGDGVYGLNNSLGNAMLESVAGEAEVSLGSFAVVVGVLVVVIVF
ncbi:hypothetical protein MBLNU230_g5721t1 [Neophaeotheca triangularis]